MKNCKFHGLGAAVFVLGHGHISYTLKRHYFFSSSLLPGMDQTNEVYNTDSQGRVNYNCKFHDPRCEAFCVWAWPYQSYSEN